MTVFDRLRDWLDQGRSVQRVADDMQLTSELILLVRMMFADDELKQRELQTFKRICQTAFGIPEDDVPAVIQYLKEIGYETTAADAAEMFRGMSDDRKRTLLLHMLSIAKADDEVSESEAKLIRKTAEVLGLTADDIAAARNG